MSQEVFAESSLPFSDVSSNAYFYTPVKTALQRRIIVSSDSFRPADPLTRAEYVTMVIKTLAIPTDNFVNPEITSFSDVPKDFWGYPFIEAGKKIGIIEGTRSKNGTSTGLFKPHRPVNRAEAAVILMRALRQVNNETDSKEGSSQAGESINSLFPDAQSVGWAKDAIRKSAQAGFFVGYKDGFFRPANNILRAEGVTVLARVMEKLDSQEVEIVFQNSNVLPGEHFSEVPKYRWRSSAISRIKATFPGYKQHNLKLYGSNAVFFAFHPKDANIPFGWYRMNAKDPLARPVRFLSSSEFSLLFKTAFSPDGSEMLVTAKTGEIFAENLETDEQISLGVFIENFTSGEFPAYSYPAYTPDGKYIILHNPWKNLLVLVDAQEKDVSKGTAVEGFWLPAAGGADTPEPGEDFSVYEFSEDGSRVTFFKDQVLNLETFTKE